MFNGFSGEFQNSIDAKGRIVIPSRFRDKLGESFMLSKGLDGCLFIYSMQEWENFAEKLKTLPMANRDARAFMRYFFSSAVECEIDKQGRMGIPLNLREHACITKELVTIGVNTRIEVWSKEKWMLESDNELSEDSIAERMAELGI